jgi:hypothetical protein
LFGIDKNVYLDLFVFILELQVTLSSCIVQSGKDAFLIDDTHAFGTDFQSNPHILFGNVELLGLQVGGEGAFGVDAGVRNVVAHDHFLTGNFTFFRHCSIIFIVCLRYIFRTLFDAKTAAKVPPFFDMAKRLAFQKWLFKLF